MNPGNYDVGTTFRSIANLERNNELLKLENAELGHVIDTLTARIEQLEDELNLARQPSQR
jgi:predicted RNase H-like nuclease (RuvC/YqgF family)